jgi:hypothetical protein
VRGGGERAGERGQVVEVAAGVDVVAGGVDAQAFVDGQPGGDLREGGSGAVRRGW